jgi:NagD protein
MKKHGLMIYMDGVLYTGQSLVPGADDFVKRLIDNDIKFTFLSNNSQRTQSEVVKKLFDLAIKVSEENVFTSAMATGYFLKDHHPGATAFVLGEGGLIKRLEDNGNKNC